MKKRILSLLLVVGMVLAVMPLSVFAADGCTCTATSGASGEVTHGEGCPLASGSRRVKPQGRSAPQPVASLNGSGTDVDPYRISTVEELTFLATEVNTHDLGKSPYASAHYMLMKDLDLNPGKTITKGGKDLFEWPSIGNDVARPFMGVFDGNGNTIRGLYINTIGEDDGLTKGLFGALGKTSAAKGATVKNLTVEGGQLYVGRLSGAIAGMASYSTLENCHNRGVSVTGVAEDADQIGGIVGLSSDSTVQDCSNSAAVCSSPKQKNTSGSMYYGADVTNAVGGIVGKNESKVVNCANSGKVSIVNWPSLSVGGVVGENSATGQLVNCINSGEVINSPDDPFAAGNPAGGVVGLNTSATSAVSFCYSLSGDGKPALVGKNEGDLTGCGTFPTVRSTVQLQNDFKGTTDQNTQTTIYVPDKKTSLVTALNGWVRGTDVQAAAANYWTLVGNPVPTLKTDPVGTTTTSLSVNETAITYGESVTLTATVTKATVANPDNLEGFVRFIKMADGKEIGTAGIDTNGKATLTVGKDILQAASGGHSLGAAFISTNDCYTDSIETDVTVTVAQKQLTITAKLDDIYQYKALPDLTYALTYTGFVEGEGMYTTQPTLTATYTAAYAPGVTPETSGEKEILVTASGKETNTNYKITLTPGKLTVHPAKSNPPVAELPKKPIDQPVIIAEPKNLTHRLRAIFAPLTPTEQAEATGWLKKQGVTDAAKMQLYELELQVSEDSGATWRKATVKDVEGGKIQVALPVLEGTSPATYDFLFYHLVNGPSDGGDKLSFTYDEASKSLYATVSSFSPYAIVATPKSPGGPSDSGGPSDDDEEYAFWMAVKAKIEKANKGDVLKADAQFYGKMPESVMEALRKHPDVTLVISWKGGQPITIPAGKAQKPEAGRIHYPLPLLAELYKDVQFVEAPAGTGPINPVTGGPGYLSYTDGRQIPLTGGSLLVVDAPEVQQSITAPHAGPEADTAPDAPGTAKGSGAGLAVLAALVAALLGGVWFWKKRNTTQSAH